VDPDHLDIYGDSRQMHLGFEEFIKLIAGNGQLFIQSAAERKLNLKGLDHLSRITYGINEGEIHAENITAGIDFFKFDYVGPTRQINDLVLKVPGFHNVENALVAIAVVDQLGLSEEEITQGLVDFK